MAGAYVAKPAVSTALVEGVDTPDGWSVDWPFCGVSGYDPDPFFPAPYPPGYTPDFSLVMTATESIAFSGTAAVTGSMRDHSTFATNEPSAINWTATIDGEAVSLRFSGDEDYEVSLSSSVAFSTYWGAAPSIEFELTEENAGDTVTLTGKSTIGSEVVTEESEIAIASAFKVELTVSANIDSVTYPGSEWHAEVTSEIDEVVNETGQKGEAIFHGGKSGTEFEFTQVLQGTGPSLPVATADDTALVATIDINELAGELFEIELYLLSPFCITTFTVELIVSVTDGDVLETITDQVTLDYDGVYIWGQQVWLTIDGTTGETTIVNPIS